MKRVIPYWEKGAEWANESFFIKRLESKTPVEATEVPRTMLPRNAFLFMLEGEVLADIDGKSYLCRGGQFLLIPGKVPFAVHHYKDLSGFTGSFELSSLKDVSYPCLTAGKPVLHTFWFDEATFIAGIMDRIQAASSRGDMGYVLRAFDLVLYSLQAPGEKKAHPTVNQFLEMIFDRSQAPDSVSGYAAQLGISPSYLNKLVRTQTRHSAMDWVEIARVNWAKCLLKDPSLSIAEVSIAVGMDDPSYFTRFFRKATGLTPSEFRKQAQKSPGIGLLAY